MNEEIRNFCSNTKICDFVRNNDFVRTTITTIVGYLIRRNYLPTKYFKCPTFFNIHEQGESSESALFNEIKQFLTNSPHQFREHYQGIYDIFARHIKAKAKEEKESLFEQPEHLQTNDKEQDSKPTQDQTQKSRQFQEEDFFLDISSQIFLILNSGIYKIPCLLLNCRSKFFYSLINDHQYYVKTKVSKEAFQSINF